ncbi:hypothetical protein DdX_04305 [Ditylenchus destructor]|uniref:Uncharacterized protein n=1 Tax=Ditylenchus destructor TaxID=166010 RepID=A0AAD4NBQ6_9BILA|nr:hypothetical protein DdX_04305 [Ditylenchus destructor]
MDENAAEFEPVSKQNRNALLAFYNLFSRSLSAEDCATPADTVYLLRTVVNFIQRRGKLQYVPHGSFGFKECATFLQSELESIFCETLNPNNATAGDEFEILKILLLLLFLFRMAMTKEFEDFANLLTTKQRMHVADMIKYLEYQDLWSDTGSWATVLSQAASTDSFNVSRSSYDCDPGNSSFNKTDAVAEELTPRKDDGKSTRRAVNYRFSPIASLSRSTRKMKPPTPTSVIKQLRKENEEMAIQLRGIGAELDDAVDMGNNLREENRKLSRHNEDLSVKVRNLRDDLSDAEPYRELYEQVKEERDRYKQELEMLQEERNNSLVLNRNVMVERDFVLKEAECAKNERDSLEKMWKKSVDALKKEAASHNDTRQKLAECKSKYSCLEDELLKSANEANSLQEQIESRRLLIRQQTAQILKKDEQIQKLTEENQALIAQLQQRAIRCDKDVQCNLSKPQPKKENGSLNRQNDRRTNYSAQRFQPNWIGRSVFARQCGVSQSGDSCMGSSMSQASSIANIEERVEELKRRNAMVPRHLQDNYFPEMNYMPDSVNVLPNNSDAPTKKPKTHWGLGCLTPVRRRKKSNLGS